MPEWIEYLTHDCFRIKDQKNNLVIYTDPYKLNHEHEKADIILISHGHFDHCSPPDVRKIQKPSTVIITTQDCADKVAGNVEKVSPGLTVNVRGVEIKAVPAYNTNKRYHPKVQNWCGYVFNVNGKNIYHAGDTDKIPEMSELGEIDVALIPVSGIYVMTADEAAQACNEMIKPKLAIPMHYGVVAGEKADADKFKELCECEVQLKKPEDFRGAEAILESCKVQLLAEQPKDTKVDQTSGSNMVVSCMRYQSFKVANERLFHAGITDKLVYSLFDLVAQACKADCDLYIERIPRDSSIIASFYPKK